MEAKKQDAEKSALEIWKDALTNVMPHVEVRSPSSGWSDIPDSNANLVPDRKISYVYEVVDICILEEEMKNLWQENLLLKS